MTYPLADRRLIELLLQIPVEHFFAGGKKRGLIRKAMEGILPEKIRNRNSKGQYSPGYTGLIRNDIGQIIHMIENGYLNSSLYKLIDVQKLKIQLKNLSESEIEDSFTYFNWTLVEIAMWVYFCKTLETK
jgi:asparagine synthase (glutamine-hydrolysing)